MTKKLFYYNGKHRIEDVSITVDDVMILLSAGMSVEQIEDRFPELGVEDIRACIIYAADCMEQPIMRFG